MVRARWLLLVAIASLAHASVAHAWSVALPRWQQQWSAPVLAGDHALWASPTRGGALAVRSASRAGAPRIVARLPTYRHDIPRAQLAASPRRLAVEQSFDNGNDREPNQWDSVDVFAGEPAGPLTRLGGRCYDGVYARVFGAVDVSGDALVYWDCASHAAVVDDAAAGTSEEIPGSSWEGLRLAGRYVAWVNGPYAEEENGGPPDSVLVYDRRLRRVVYSVPIERAAQVDDVDLGADGTVVLGGQGVSWASPDEPRLHRLPLRRAIYGVRVAGARVGFARTLIGIDEATTDIGYIGLHADREHVVVSGAVSSLDSDHGIGDFDFDGQRFAYEALGCRRLLLHVRVARGHVDAFHRHGCALRFTRRPRVSGRRVSVHVECTAFQFADCTAHDVRIRIRHALVARGPTAARVRITARGRKLLTRPRRVTIAATLRDYAGRKERRSARVTLGG